MTLPRIGEPRVYDGATLPVLYPGERARAQCAPIPSDHLADGPVPVVVTGWMVEPAPGWHAKWLRLRWRIWGRWVGGPPKLEATAPIRRTRGRT